MIILKQVFTARKKTKVMVHILVEEEGKNSIFNYYLSERDMNTVIDTARRLSECDNEEDKILC